MTDDLATIRATIASIQSREADRAAVNRQRLRNWDSDFADLAAELKARGMFGKMTKLEVP